jgi:hypothetical protein
MNSENSNIKELILKIFKDNHITSFKDLMMKLEDAGVYIDPLELRTLISTMVRDGLLIKEVDEVLKKFVIRLFRFS